jgi:hypothetical protein
MACKAAPEESFTWSRISPVLCAQMGVTAI